MSSRGQEAGGDEQQRRRPPWSLPLALSTTSSAEINLSKSFSYSSAA
jgi:hypothetical protein